MCNSSKKKKFPSSIENRIGWLDLTKGIGIILVLLAHALPKNNIVWIFINQFHMPLFFIISGYLYSKRASWMKFVIRKIRTLWIPFVFTSLLTRLISLLFGYNSEFSIKSILKLLLLFEAGPLLGAIWFLRVLFYSIIFYDLLTRIFNKVFKSKAETIIMIVSIILLFIGVHTQLAAQASVILNSISFIHFGQELKKRNLIDIINLPIAILFIVLCLVISLFNTTSYIGNLHTYPLMFVISAILGSTGLISLCNCIYKTGFKTRLLEYIGKESMGAMIWQFISFKAVISIQIVCYNLDWERISDFPVIYDYATALWVIMDVVLGLFLSIIIFRLINKPIDNIAAKVEQWLFSKKNEIADYSGEKNVK